MTRKRDFLTWLSFITTHYCFMILRIEKRAATPVGLSRCHNVTYEETKSSPAKLQRMEGPQKVRLMV